MPKGKKKGKSSGFTKSRYDFNGTSDEDSNFDNCSVISLTSDCTNAEEGSDDVDEQSQNDIFEDKLIEAIEGITQKSAQGRTNSLECVGNALSMKYVPDFVMERKLTLTDGIERCLKKGRGLEQVAAAQLATVLCIQLGSGEMTDQVCNELSPILTFIVNDTSMGLAARSKCAWALGCLSFLANTDDLGDTMVTLQDIFSGSYHKGDGTVPNISTELAILHQSAISAWSLLLTVVDFETAQQLPTIQQLCELLDSPHLEVRMAAGEAIALLLEQMRESSSGKFMWEVKDDLLDKLRQLATDSHKYRAKKDRKTQRSIFRDILKYVEDDEPPCIQVRFGQECLSLDSWGRKKQYDSFCQLLGSGVNLHLSENEFLREILELGEKISPLNLSNNKQTKVARHQMNAANFKARCISRGKNRDKRCAVILT